MTSATRGLPTEEEKEIQRLGEAAGTSWALTGRLPFDEADWTDLEDGNQHLARVYVEGFQRGLRAARHIPQWDTIRVLHGLDPVSDIDSLRLPGVRAVQVVMPNVAHINAMVHRLEARAAAAAAAPSPPVVSSPSPPRGQAARSSPRVSLQANYNLNSGWGQLTVTDPGSADPRPSQTYRRVIDAIWNHLTFADTDGSRLLSTAGYDAFFGFRTCDSRHQNYRVWTEEYTRQENRGIYARSYPSSVHQAARMRTNERFARFYDDFDFDYVRMPGSGEPALTYAGFVRWMVFEVETSPADTVMRLNTIMPRIGFRPEDYGLPSTIPMTAVPAARTAWGQQQLDLGAARYTGSQAGMGMGMGMGGFYGGGFGRGFGGGGFY